MRVVAALVAAAVVLHLAFNWGFQAVLGPGMDQAVANVEALGEMSSADGPMKLRYGTSDTALRAATRPIQPREVRPVPRGSGGWKAKADETRPGGWGAAIAP